MSEAAPVNGLLLFPFWIGLAYGLASVQFDELRVSVGGKARIHTCISDAKIAFVSLKVRDRVLHLTPVNVPWLPGVTLSPSLVRHESSVL